MGDARRRLEGGGLGDCDAIGERVRGVAVMFFFVFASGGEAIQLMPGKGRSAFHNSRFAR